MASTHEPTPPAAGQVWGSDDEEVVILHAGANAVIVQRGPRVGRIRLPKLMAEYRLIEETA